MKPTSEIAPMTRYERDRMADQIELSLQSRRLRQQLEKSRKYERKTLRRSRKPKGLKEASGFWIPQEQK